MWPLGRRTGLSRPFVHVLTSLAVCALLSARASSVALAQSGPANEGSGSGWLDCDGDLDLDFLYISVRGDLCLFRNDGGSFADVTAWSVPVEVTSNQGAPMGVSCGDVNQDGYTDLFLTRQGANSLLLNDGTGIFRAVTREAGIGGKVFSASSAFFDYDGDGLLDLYVANYGDAANQLFHNQGIDEDGVPHFMDVARDLGVDFGHQGQSNFCLGLAVFDYDNDGDSDLYIANDFGGIDFATGDLLPGDNILFRNEGDGSFTDVSYSSGTADAGWAMGVDFGDYNQDGWIDLWVTNLFEDALLENQGDGTFINVSREVGLITGAPEELQYNGWGTAFLDFDNDGDLDIHVTNGYILTNQNLTFNEPNQLWENLGPDAHGVYRFREIGKQAGIDDVGDGRGAAYADFDQDGLMDFAVTNSQPVSDPSIVPSPQFLLYRNEGDGTFRDLAGSAGIRPGWPDGPRVNGYRDLQHNRWVQVELRSSSAGRCGIGSRVTVEAGGRTWVDDLGTSSYCSQNELVLHFGLGTLREVDRITARFTSGAVVILENPSLDTRHILYETEATTPVRLLDLDAARTPSGVRIAWRVTDDGESYGLELTRTAEGLPPQVWNSRSQDGTGTVSDRDAPIDRSLTYTLTAIHRDGQRAVLGTRELAAGVLPAVALGAAYPNPFASAATVELSGMPGTPFTLRILDVTGRVVRTVNGYLNPGTTSVTWDGRTDHGGDAPAGTYLAQVAGMRNGIKISRRP